MEGILWQDTDENKSIEQKVAEAVAYVRTKYGFIPNCCLINSGLNCPEYVEGTKIAGVSYMQPTLILVGRTM